ncbi:MAG: hypothetical protein ACR2HA_07105 [Nocardioides sp.]
MLSDRSTTLYRAFDSRGRLLYVGISDSPFLRFGQHDGCSGWAAHATRLDLERFQSREAAAATEATAIRDEDPVWNMAGRPMGRFMQWMAAYPNRDPDEIDPDAVARDALAQGWSQ